MIKSKRKTKERFTGERLDKHIDKRHLQTNATPNIRKLNRNIVEKKEQWRKRHFTIFLYAPPWMQG